MRHALKLFEVWGTDSKPLTLNIRYFSQLFWSYMVLLVVAITGFFWVSTSVAKQYIQDQTIQNLSNQLTIIERVFQQRPNLAFNDEWLRAFIINHRQHRLTVIKTNGHVIFDSNQPTVGMDNHLNRPEIRMASTSPFGVALRESKTLSKPLVYVAKLASNEHFYRVAVPLESLRHEWGRVQQKIIIYSIIVFVFCLLLTFVMSHWIASPIQQSIVVLNAIKNREFYAMSPKKSFIREINNLNQSLVDVANNISRFIAKQSKEKEKKDLILNNMINGLIIYDSHMGIVLMNKSAFGLFFNASQSNATMHLSDYPELFSFAQDILKTKDVDPIEIDHGNGKTILISGSIYSDGTEPRGILIAQDITKLKRLESTRQAFVANVSHELKTPITFIRSMFETLIIAKEKQLDVQLSMIKKGVLHSDRLTQIIDDLLQLSKLETSGGAIEKYDVSLEQLIGEVVNHCHTMADQKQIYIRLNHNDVIIHANQRLLEQALKNLLENAIKYSKNETTVTIFSTRSDDGDMIHVQDEGPGIADAHIDKLFQRFYRVDTARSREMGGTGLGLAIVKHIAIAHGGRASVKSTVGVGTTFTIHLPKK